MHMCHEAQEERSEDNLWEIIFSLQNVGSKNQTQVTDWLQCSIHAKLSCHLFIQIMHHVSDG